MAYGRFYLKMATLRVGTYGAGVPDISPTIDSPSITVTAANNNSATVFMFTDCTLNATARRRVAIPFTAGQSLSFTGVPIGESGFRNVAFATPSNAVYFAANSTPMVMVLSYYKMDQS
jgi:hypothetical protein